MSEGGGTGGGGEPPPEMATPEVTATDGNDDMEGGRRAGSACLRPPLQSKRTQEFPVPFPLAPSACLPWRALARLPTRPASSPEPAALSPRSSQSTKRRAQRRRCRASSPGPWRTSPRSSSSSSTRPCFRAGSITGARPASLVSGLRAASAFREMMGAAPARGRAGKRAEAREASAAARPVNDWVRRCSSGVRRDGAHAAAAPGWARRFCPPHGALSFFGVPPDAASPSLRAAPRSGALPRALTHNS